MPYTIASQRRYLADFDVVLMGMPDTVIEPPSAFARLAELHINTKSDLTLGLFRTDERNPGGLVDFDEATLKVSSHVDKTSPHFPAHAENSWAIVAWGEKFTGLLCDAVDTGRRSPLGGELLFGDLIDMAIAHPNLTVSADFIDRRQGFYWDITNPAKYFELIQMGRQDSSNTGRVAETPSKNPASDHLQRSFFISHSAMDSAYAHNLVALLTANKIHGSANGKDLRSEGLDAHRRNLIRSCTNYVLLLSNNALRSGWIQDELEYVRMLDQVRVQVIELEPISDSESVRLGMYRRSMTQWLDGTSGEVAAAMEILLRGVDR